MPSYSVIITTHKRPELVGRAIASVRAQKAERVQVVLVCDSPCAETYAIASTLLAEGDLFLQRSGTPGPAASRNLGLDVADGDFILFLDDDDALSPEFLATAEKHASHTEILYTDLFLLYEKLEGRVSTILEGERRSLSVHPLDSIYTKNFIPLPCLIYPRAAVAECRYDPSLILNEDWDFILNVMAVMPLRYLPIDGPVVYCRIQPDNRGRSNNHLLEDTYRRIYRNRPAPTAAHKEARQSLFASFGLDLALNEV